MPSKCWDCEHNSLRLKILVPHDRTIKEYMHNTGNFQSDIIAVVKEKREQYTIWYRQDSDVRLVTFKVLHTCHLNMDKPKKDSNCTCYIQKQEPATISNITYSKLPTPEEPQAPTTDVLSTFEPMPFTPVNHE